MCLFAGSIFAVHDKKKGTDKLETVNTTIFKGLDSMPYSETSLIELLESSTKKRLKVYLSTVCKHLHKEHNFYNGLLSQ